MIGFEIYSKYTNILDNPRSKLPHSLLALAVAIQVLLADD